MITYENLGENKMRQYADLKTKAKERRRARRDRSRDDRRDSDEGKVKNPYNRAKFKRGEF